MKGNNNNNESLGVVSISLGVIATASQKEEETTAIEVARSKPFPENLFWNQRHKRPFLSVPWGVLLLCGFNGSCCQPRGGIVLQHDWRVQVKKRWMVNPHVLRGSHLYCFLESKQHGEWHNPSTGKRRKTPTRLLSFPPRRPKWELSFQVKIQGEKKLIPGIMRDAIRSINPLGTLAHSPSLVWREF